MHVNAPLHRGVSLNSGWSQPDVEQKQWCLLRKDLSGVLSSSLNVEALSSSDRSACVEASALISSAAAPALRCSVSLLFSCDFF